jgi:hypothetical protein
LLIRKLKNAERRMDVLLFFIKSDEREAEKELVRIVVVRDEGEKC